MNDEKTCLKPRTLHMTFEFQHMPDDVNLVHVMNAMQMALCDGGKYFEVMLLNPPFVKSITEVDPPLPVVERSPYNPYFDDEY